jgi:2EXR family
MALQYQPIVYVKQGKDIPSEAYSEVSSKSCRYYNAGRRCSDAEKGYCRFVHDSTLRNEAIDRQRLARQRAFNDKARASAYQKLQQDYNDRRLDSIASIQAQITTVVSTINKNDPSIANSRVKLQEFYNNAKSLAAKATDAPVQASNDDSNIEKTEPVVKDIDSINSTNADMKIEEDQPVRKEMDKYPSPQNNPTNEKDVNGSLKEHCQKYVKYRCKSKDQCLRFHDYEARKKYRKEKNAAKKTSKDAGDTSENKTDNPAAVTQSKQEPFSATLEQDSKCQNINPRATKTIKKVFMPDHKQDNETKISAATKPQKKVKPQPQQSKALITYAEATSKSIVPVPVPEAPRTRAVVKVETPEAGIYVAAPSWDLEYFAAWASKNLKPTTATKFLAGCGRIPLKLLDHNHETAPTTGPTTFHYFQLLPFELRAQIYEIALESESYKCRIIRQWEDEKGKICGKNGRQKQQRFTPKVPRST